ncbi:MAG TPA: class I SAM-dependent methyltransferase [Candidatus Saccharimonadales bacterium]|nr:class I SAM-dependent methyltransferase [Candidatus Saccharimonadales bacterium]
MILSHQDKQIHTTVYKEYARLHMEDGWADNHKLENFKLMMHLIELTDTSLDTTACLDVGCGTGDFSAFARKFGTKQYLGIDVYEPAIIKARRKYPKEQFILGDFLAIPIDQAFDYAFCSGGLSIKLDTDNYAFLEAIITKMWQLIKIGLVFNMLIDTDTNPDPDLFFYHPPKVLEICKRIGTNAKIEIKQHPVRAEMHVYMYR